MDGHGNHHGHMMPGHNPELKPMCSMNVYTKSLVILIAMLFTWDTTNLCIIFPSWQIQSTTSLILSLLVVVALTAGYEAVRELSRRYENGGAIALHDVSVSGRARNAVGGYGGRRSKTVKGLFYAIQVFYSFFIMLLFMTYNGWVMLAVAVGAFVGFMAFGNGTATKTVACH